MEDKKDTEPRFTQDLPVSSASVSESVRKDQLELALAAQQEEMKQTIKKLEEKDRSIKIAVLHADMYYFEINLDTKQVHYGDKMLSDFPLQPEMENFPESWLALGFVHPDDLEDYRRTFARLYNGETQIEWECRCLDIKTKRYIWRRTSITVLPKEAGMPLKAVATAQNIQSEKRLENLYQSELENRKNIVADMVASCRVNLTQNQVEDFWFGGTNVMRPQYEKLTNYRSRMQLIFDDISLSDEANADLSPESLIKLYLSGTRSAQHTYHATDRTTGKIRWINVKVNLLASSVAGDIVAFFYSHDVTNLRRNAELSRIAARDREMLTTAVRVMFPMAISVNLTQNSYYMIEYDNFDTKKAPESGCFDDLIKSALTSIPEEHRVEFFSVFNRQSLLKAHRNGDKRVTLNHKQFGADGILHWNRTTVVFVENPLSDDILEITMTDCIDSQKQTEEALRNSESELRLALKAAKRASLAKSDFLARMSHDMRTPMNGILGLSYIMEGQTDINEIKKEIPKLRESGEYLLQLINDVLDVNKVESGKLMLFPKPCDEQKVFDSIIAMVKPQIETKNIDFTFEKINIDWTYMMLDAQRVKQIFVNLLTNAIKFTPFGGKIHFTMELVYEDENMIRDRFVIRDNGIGMSEEFLPKLFLPFSQENRVHEDLGGTGLGLSIVKNLVELMGGNISVKSKINEGSEFTLYLNFPLAKEPPVETDITNPQTARPPLGTNILLCEDHPLNAQIAKRLLENVGCSVTWVKDGQEGVDAFAGSAEGEFDIVLMDIRMPKMNGLDAARNIRTLSRNDALSVPIVAMTANAYDEDVEQSRIAGMTAHLSKPIEPNLLFRTIANLLIHKK